jgi:transcription elongation GreA/GreB family factor
MSRAFVKDDDGGMGNEDLPDRLISEHPNLVTPEGLAAIEAEVARFAQAYGAGQVSADRVELQRIARDLRYWSSRLQSAKAVAPPKDTGEVQFGSTVTIERPDGRRQIYRIVGDDEANPAQGTLSYVSPLAQALMGKVMGDVVRAGASDAEIIAIA